MANPNPRQGPGRKPQVGSANQLNQYKRLPSAKRYEAAIRLIEEEGWSQRSAAAATGISRSRLNERMQQRQEQLALEAERSALAKAERQIDAPRQLEVANERLRVPPPDEFLRMYFGGWMCWDCGRSHEWQPFHYEILDHCTDPQRKRVLFNIPPGHGKSTVATTISTVYEIVKDRNSQTAIMSKTDEMAELMLGQIKSFLMDPSMYEGSARNLIEDFGPFSAQSHLGDSGKFFVTGRQSREKDPTVRAFGLTSHIYGMRAHRIICDDIADTDNQSRDQVEAQLRKITQTFQSRVGQSGKIIIVGTRVMPGDIYSKLLELPAYEALRYPCIIDDVEERVLFPDHFPYAAAALQRDSMSSEQWQLVYQNVAQAGFGASFQLEHLEKCYDTTRKQGNVPEGLKLIAGLDPAGAGERSGYTAFVLLGVDLSTGRYYLVDLVNHKQMRAPQIYDQMLDWASRYNIHEFRVEYNTLQQQLFQFNQTLIAGLTRHGVRLTGHRTNQNKWDPEFGVETMAPLFHNGQVSIPWGDIGTRTRFKMLCDQLLEFGMGGTSDLVMAMWFAYLGCRELYQRSAKPAYDTRMPVPARMRRNRRVRAANGRLRTPTLEETSGLSLADRLMIEEARRRTPVNMSA